MIMVHELIRECGVMAVAVLYDMALAAHVEAAFKEKADARLTPEW